MNAGRPSFTGKRRSRESCGRDFKPDEDFRRAVWGKEKVSDQFEKIPCLSPSWSLVAEGVGWIGACGLQGLSDDREKRARYDPLWAILSNPAKKGRKWTAGDFRQVSGVDISRHKTQLEVIDDAANHSGKSRGGRFYFQINCDTNGKQPHSKERTKPNTGLRPGGKQA